MSLLTRRLPLASLQPHAERLAEFLVTKERIFCLGGAGVSTESGIPDYRSPGRPPYKPMTFQQFVQSAAIRRRYWARSYVGFPTIRHAQPNQAHLALAALERAGKVEVLLTQNVDSLHQKGGSQRVRELHGSLRRAVCLSCGSKIGRDALQEQMAEENPEWTPHTPTAAVPEDTTRPDGDVELDPKRYDSFHTPHCGSCGSDMVKPDVVLFGETVPRQLVAESVQQLREKSDALLVVGSSLHVWSGFRFVRYAAEDPSIPIAIAGIGETRGDPLAQVKVEGPLPDLLAHTIDLLGLTSSSHDTIIDEWS